MANLEEIENGLEDPTNNHQLRNGNLLNRVNRIRLVLIVLAHMSNVYSEDPTKICKDFCCMMSWLVQNYGVTLLLIKARICDIIIESLHDSKSDTLLQFMKLAYFELVILINIWCLTNSIRKLYQLIYNGNQPATHRGRHALRMSNEVFQIMVTTGVVVVNVLQIIYEVFQIFEMFDVITENTLENPADHEGVKWLKRLTFIGILFIDAFRMTKTTKQLRKLRYYDNRSKSYRQRSVLLAVSLFLQVLIVIVSVVLETEAEHTIWTKYCKILIAISTIIIAIINDFILPIFVTFEPGLMGAPPSDDQTSDPTGGFTGTEGQDMF